MKNRIISITFLFLTTLCANAATSVDIVRSFGENMSSWTQTGSLKYHKALEQLCNGKIKVQVFDDLSSFLFKKYNYPDGSKDFASYLLCMEKEISNGISITYSNYRRIQAEELSASLPKDIEVVACNISALISNNQHLYQDLFYVKNGYIAKIDKREMVTDKKTGHKKVRVDFDDLIEHYESVGFTYNYGQHFPVGGSFNYSPEDIPLMVSIDFGVNFDKDKYIIDEVEMTDIMNYKRTKKTLDPKFFISVTPHVYLKYFAIGCGVGILYMSGTEDTSTHSYSSSSSSSSSVSVSVSGGTSASLSSSTEMIKPMIRPVLKGFIPISDELFITVSAGYDLVFGYKDKNGFNVGLGFQWEL